MLPKELEKSLLKKIAHADHPRELVVDAMLALQDHYGYLSDEAVEQTAALLGMTALEVEVPLGLPELQIPDDNPMSVEKVELGKMLLVAEQPISYTLRFGARPCAGIGQVRSSRPC